MVPLNKEFKTLFNELTDLFANVKTTVDNIDAEGEKLDQKLLLEIENFRSRWNELTFALGNQDRLFSDEEKKAHRSYVFNSSLASLFIQAPYYEQIMTKPWGYAGDAEMMEIIYRNQFEGKTPIGRFIHKHAVICKACQAVRNRRKLLRDLILSKGRGDIMSMAAGPAREIRDVLAMNPVGDRYSFLALDHDINTVRMVRAGGHDRRLEYGLSNAFSIIKGRTDIAHPRKIFLDQCDPRADLTGWKKLVSPVKYRFSKLEKGKYDLVYSAGLFDYIKTFDDNDERGAVKLTRQLFDLVKPGGSLVIGNFNETIPMDIWFTMEFICDWQLIYRDDEQLLDFTRTIPEDQIDGEPWIETEDTGINSFLRVDKK